MKKIFYFIILVSFSISCFSQENFSDISKKDKWHWMGIDFSHAKLIGDGFNDPDKIVNHFFQKWNTLIVWEEKEKYDVPGAFRMKKWYESDSTFYKSHENVDPTKLVRRRNTYSLTKGDIEEIVDGYNIKDNDFNIKLVFIVETLNKTNKEATVWITVFNENKDILLCERMSGIPGGFGIRNYWARSFHNIIKEIEEVKYSHWRRKY